LCSPVRPLQSRHDDSEPDGLEHRPLQPFRIGPRPAVERVAYRVEGLAPQSLHHARDETLRIGRLGAARRFDSAAPILSVHDPLGHGGSQTIFTVRGVPQGVERTSVRSTPPA
jgi:hypothetical protein